ncbi:MAG: ABC transporter ATP-binding protein [bacterium]
MIKIKKLTKIYRMGDEKINALYDVDLNIEKGDFVALIGPSGSGKSTLMNMVGALDYPDKGKISVENDEISQMTSFQRANYRNSKVGFVFQTFNLQGHLTALENVEIPLIFAGIRRGLRRQMAKEALETVGLGDRMDHKPNELSGGQQQRVSIARAIVNKPEILLADEPTGNLDTKTGILIMDILKDLNEKEKVTVIMVTHNEQHSKYANKVYHLIDGKIVKKRK